MNITEHILSLCKNADRKLHALSHVSRYMTLNKRHILMKSFIISQFSYCLLIWMIHNRGLNIKINQIRERALRIVYDDCSSSFEDLLNKDNSVTIHQRNLQQLVIDIFQVKLGIAPIIMDQMFTFVENNTYNLRSGMHLNRANVHSTQYDVESIGNLETKIRNLVPAHIKYLKTLSTFKNQIKKWIPKDCKCRLCKVYVAQVGFFVEASKTVYLLLWNTILLFLFIQFLFYSILFYFFIGSIYVIYVFHFYSCIYLFYKFIYLFIDLLF